MNYRKPYENIRKNNNNNNWLSLVVCSSAKLKFFYKQTLFYLGELLLSFSV